MLNPSLRDIQYRKVRFILAILGVALLFMLILVMDGIAEGMKTWLTQYLRDTKADTWVIQTDTEGPFTSYSLLSENTADKISSIAGIDQADPLILTLQNTKVDGENKRIYLVGHQLEGIGGPKKLKEGRHITARRETVVDENLDLRVEEKIKIAGQSFKVVGKSKNTTYAFNSPIVFISLKDAQEILFNKQTVVNTVAITKEPASSLSSISDRVKNLEGVEVKTQKEMLDIVLKQVEQPLRAITFFQNMFWLVGALIVSMIVYVTAVERTRDFAIFKAIGATNKYITQLVLLQALFIGLIATAGGAGMALFLAPAFPMKITIPAASLASTPLIAIGVSVLSSLIAVRKATRVDPALAFGGR